MRGVVRVMGLVFLALLIGVAAPAAAQGLIHDVEFRPLSPAEQARSPYQLQLSDHFTFSRDAVTAQYYLLAGDRMEYWADDVNGQFYAMLELPKEPVPAAGAPPAAPADPKAQEAARLARLKGLACRIRITPQGGGAPIERRVGNVTSGKVVFLVSVGEMKPGDYVAQAVMLDAQGAEIGKPVEFKFSRVDKRNPVIPIPAEGIPINLESQSFVPNAAWPVRMGVPLPINAVTDVRRLALFENGVQVPVKVQATATWCPKGSVQWALVDFIGRWKDGKPAEYRLKLTPIPTAPRVTTLKCTETADKIVVDTGAVRFEVGKKKFAGIETAWFDPAGAGKYDELNPVIKGAGGPYILDGRLIRFDASLDTKTSVVLEESGPVRATILATGWYTGPEVRSGPPLCQYVTRITACAGQSQVRVSHRTILTYDTRMNWLADAGFGIATVAETFRLGADGVVKAGKLPAAPVFLHQDQAHHFRIVGMGDKPVEGKTSDGWFAVRGAGDAAPEVAVVLREIWQKFPKEVEMSKDGLTLHFWPKHGHRAFTLEDELKIKNIYKFWCFHQGPMLNLTMPMDYYEKFATDYSSAGGDGTAECRPEHALNGNGQGLAIGNEFDLILSAPRDAADLPARAKLFQFDPTAAATPDWNANTGAMGRMAAVDNKNFAPMEEAMEKGWLSHTRCVERGDEYGMWIYPDTHTYWDATQDRAMLHRVWHNSHYHEVGMTWIQYFRTGSSGLLRWARPNTDHWMNVGTVNYADPNNYIKGHVGGAMYHCKGLTPWGGELAGMVRRDSHSGLWGHWVDPDPFLWCWYMDGDPRAREMYALWAESFVKKSGAPLSGTRREANTTEAYLVNYYQATWDADALPAIYGMGDSLRTMEPLEKQNPGPMWHPMWINRYYELTRDPDYRDFILKYARMTTIENTWTIALAALAYDLSGDKTYLTQHLGAVDSFPQRYFHSPGDLYDWYGVGPGPLGSSWAYDQWGFLLRALHGAGITTTAQDNPPGAYPWTPPKLVVLALKTADKPFTFRARASSFGGDLHPTDWAMFAPSGKRVVSYQFKGGGPSAIDQAIPVPADGETGLYRIEISTHEANVSRPLTDLPAEVALIPNDRRLASKRLGNYVMPVGGANEPVTVVVDSNSDWTPCNYVIEDAAGKRIGQGSLFRPRAQKSVTLTIDPQRHAWPIKIDTYGFTGVKLAGKCDGFIMADNPETLKMMAPRVPPKK